MTHKILPNIISLLLLYSMVSCTMPRIAPLKKTPLPGAYRGQNSDTLTIAGMNWKTFFKDQYLAALIDTALKQNAELQAALEQIKIANAYYKISRGSFYPTAELTALSFFARKQTDTSDPASNYGVNLNVSWEIDLWGRLKKAKKGAQLRMIASHYGKQFIQTMLVADVARAYYELLAFDAELGIIERNIRSQDAALEIVRAQKLAGKTTNLAVQQFEAQLYNTWGQKHKIQQMIISSENYLNLLLNRFPQKIDRCGELTQQQLSDEVWPGIPMQLLENRPDVSQASVLLEATGYDLEAARKSFYPNLKIKPALGLVGPASGRMITNGSVISESLTTLTAPLLQQNLLKGNYLIRLSEQKQAFIKYENIVLQGFTEVQTCLDKLIAIEKEIGNRKKEVVVLEEAIKTANDLYAYGYANYLEVINAQKSAREAEFALTNAQKERLFVYINLYKSLGGGRN